MHAPERPAIPASDFADAQFDRAESAAPTRLLLIASTPRSGSTMLCDVLYRSGLCLAHEYFQPHNYMPMLARRWGCAPTDTAAYVAALRRHRTLSTGVLGINIHSEHLPLFVAAEPSLADLPYTCVHVVRRDVIAQAVSLHIALQTGQWSSEFTAQRQPSYDFASIDRRLAAINEGNAAILAYFRSRGLACVTLCYEDMAADMARAVARIPELPDLPIVGRPGLMRQANATNESFARRFADDHLEFYGKGRPRAPLAIARLDIWARRHAPLYRRLVG